MHSEGGEESDGDVVRLAVCVVLCSSIREAGKLPAILPKSGVSLKGQESRTAFPTVCDMSCKATTDQPLLVPTLINTSF